MSWKIAKDAEPQFNLLLLATALSIAIWILSLFLPLIGFALYPLRLFATFIHEGGHALAAILLGADVSSLMVLPDGSGEVYSYGSSRLSALIISSAGYLGTTAFGAAILIIIRFGVSARKLLYFSGGLVVALTIIFGFIAPVRYFFNTVSIGGFLFTVVSGLAIGATLILIAKKTGANFVNFTLAFLAVQLIFNAVFDLINVFYISTTTNIHSDAANMAAITGIPAFVWVLIWIGISLVMISLGLRIYAVRKNQKPESLFED